MLEMCLAIPARIEKIEGNEAIADFGGVKRRVRIDLIEDPHIGDYVVVHVGFAIEKLSETEAMEILDAWRGVTDEKNVS